MSRGTRRRKLAMAGLKAIAGEEQMLGTLVRVINPGSRMTVRSCNSTFRTAWRGSGSSGLSSLFGLSGSADQRNQRQDGPDDRHLNPCSSNLPLPAFPTLSNSTMTLSFFAD